MTDNNDDVPLTVAAFNAFLKSLQAAVESSKLSMAYKSHFLACLPFEVFPSVEERGRERVWLTCDRYRMPQTLSELRVNAGRSAEYQRLYPSSGQNEQTERSEINRIFDAAVLAAEKTMKATTIRALPQSGFRRFFVGSR